MKFNKVNWFLLYFIWFYSLNALEVIKISKENIQPIENLK